MRKSLLIISVISSVLLMSGCAVVSEQPEENRAVVIMSGGGAVTPFTTSEEACKTGLAAGNSDTALREFLLKEGKQVFTAPANDTWGTVAEPDPNSFGAFGDCPEALPEYLTVMSSGDIDSSAHRLALFVEYLHEQYGITDVDFVGHSNGGLYSRGAIRILKQTESPVTVRSLTMLGTPNEGAFPTEFAAGEIEIDACQADEFCVKFNEAWLKYAGTVDKGLNAEDTERFLMGEGNWNQAQEGFLDEIPVTLLAGTYWENEQGKLSLWPFDGIVPKESALAVNLSDKIIPHRTCWTAPLTHSIFVSNFANLEWDTALTWNAEALEQVKLAIDRADSAADETNREGCP